MSKGYKNKYERLRELSKDELIKRLLDAEKIIFHVNDDGNTSVCTNAFETDDYFKKYPK